MGRHRMHANSLAAFDEIEDERSARAEVIYNILLRATSPLTDRQVAQALEFTDMNMVRPRITELRDNRWVVECRSIECPVTGKQVRRVKALTAEERAGLIEKQRARWRERNAGRPIQQELTFA